MESIVRGYKRGKRDRIKDGKWKVKWEEGMVASVFIRTWREGQAEGEKSSTDSAQWIKDEREESTEWIYCDPAVLLFCFFSADTVNMEGAGSIFYRSHATSQWSMDAGPLQTYIVEHALCGSAKRVHLGERGSIPPPSLTLSPSILSTALLAHHTTLCSYFFFSTSPSFHLSHSGWKPFKNGVKQKVWQKWVFILSYPGQCPSTMIWLFLVSKYSHLKMKNVSVNSVDSVFYKEFSHQ